jgi:hypothetical protein
MKKNKINLILMSDCFYEQVDQRLRQQQADSRMMPKFTAETAGMPQSQETMKFGNSFVEHFYNPSDEK